MSTLWTPGGEHPVDREPPSAPAGRDDRPVTAPGEGGDDPFAGLSDEEREQAEQMLAGMAEAQQRLVEAPVEDVVGNHAIGLYQLAAIHLGQQPPNIREAKLAIDAMAALLDGVIGRLGEHEADLKAALTQIQLAFVQVQRSSTGAPDA